MGVLITILILLAQPAPPNIDQVRAEANPERRAKLAIEFAAAAERRAETAYTGGNMPTATSELKDMALGVELAQQAFEQTGKTPMRHPGPFKSAELKTQEILTRLADLERRMDAEERAAVEGPRNKVQEIHDAWFDGIMRKK
jgi:hypothetical protein